MAEWGRELATSQSQVWWLTIKPREWTSPQDLKITSTLHPSLEKPRCLQEGKLYIDDRRYLICFSFINFISVSLSFPIPDTHSPNRKMSSSRTLYLYKSFYYKVPWKLYQMQVAWRHKLYTLHTCWNPCGMTSAMHCSNKTKQAGKNPMVYPLSNDFFLYQTWLNMSIESIGQLAVTWSEDVI